MRAGLQHQLELFLTALGFFTRVPVPAWVPWSAERQHQAMRYFPLVGLVVGGAGAAVCLVLAQVLPPTLAVLLSLAATVRLTGALHEDGWADSCDGLGGGWDRAQILAIMKDSRIGSYGTLGLVLMLLARAAALVELGRDEIASTALALLVAHPLSRLAATAVLHRLPYVRTDADARSAALVRPLPPAALALAGVCGLVPLLLLPAPAALAAVLTVSVVTLWAARLFLRRLGGCTGDLLGATQQLAELACYLGILAAWNFT